MTRLKETDMFAPVKDLLVNQLGCSEVYGEVANYDVVGLLSNVEIIVEMKRNLSWKLIEQAWNAIGATDYVFIAIPKPKGYSNRIAQRYLKYDGIGLIYVDKDQAEIQFWGRRHKKSRRSIRKSVHSHHQETIGGVKSGEGPTEYSITMDRIKDYLRRKDWVTVDDIVANVETHYRSPKASVGDTLKAHWNTSWCEHIKEGRKTYFRLKTRC